MSSRRTCAAVADSFMAGVGEADSGVLQPAYTVVAFASYNVGIQNAEILGKNWNKTSSSKQARLKNDIADIFASQHGIQVLFLSEFGQMTPNIDSELNNDTCAWTPNKEIAQVI